jgi:CubicO group peptidase (beta-lactamase class C family)
VRRYHSRGRDRFRAGAKRSARRDRGRDVPGLAVAIVHRGRVVFAEGFGTVNVESGGPVTPDTVFQVGSVGKMLTAAAVLETVTDGKIGLHDPVARVITGLDPVIGPLTSHQLLAQMSGLRTCPARMVSRATTPMGGSSAR